MKEETKVSKNKKEDIKKIGKEDGKNGKKGKERKKEENKKQEDLKEYPYLAYVSFPSSKKVYTFKSESNQYQIQDQVIVETIRGLELGTIVRDCEVLIAQTQQELKPVIRKANAEDLKQIKENEEKAKDALQICSQIAKKLELDMHLIESEYTLDRSKLIFVYVADERVDFRELLKELAQIFRCRIELRQIGPRNKAKMVGGLGMCGMETCCSRFKTDFDVISINMAKNQMLALNVQKLSGQCGKLMCCLRYEDDLYKEAKEGLPKISSQVEYKGKMYRITSMNLLLKQVKIENKEDVQFLDFKELWPNYKG